MESTASDDIIGCMFALLDDVAMAGGGGGSGGGCGGGVDSSVVTVLKMKDLHLGPRASGKRYSGILGHTGHTYSGIIFGFGFWGLGTYFRREARLLAQIWRELMTRPYTWQIRGCPNDQ